MGTVIKELGSEAVILNSRKVRKKGLRYFFHKPLQEVMVAYDPTKIPIAKKINSGQSFNATKASARDAGADKIQRAVEQSREQLVSLDNRIDSLDNILNSFVSRFEYVKREITYDYSEEVKELFIRLINNQVREELAHEIAKDAERILKKQEGAIASEVFEQLILDKLGTPEPIRHKKFKQKVVMVIGPTGVGKTTSIVKLAANFSVNEHKKVGILNTDTYRIAAQEQLKTYADILDIPLNLVYQIEEINQAIEEMADRDIIFIDTAGKRPGDEQHREDILGILKYASPEDTLLCVSASTGFYALKEIVDSYGFVDNYKLIVTKVDETQCRGMLLNLSCYVQKIIAYITTGQNVPEDIEIIDTAAIANKLLRENNDK